MQIKSLIAKEESKAKELENQVANEDNELEKEKNKTRLLQCELENLKNDYNRKITHLEEQIKTKENEVAVLRTKEKEMTKLKNRVFNLEKQLKDSKELKPQEREILKRMDEIVKRFMLGPFGYAWEPFSEEEINRYYKEFEAKDYSQYSPEIAQYGKFFSSQLKTFKSNVSMRKANLQTIKEQKQQLEENNKEKKETTDKYDNLARQLNEANNLMEKAKLELETTLKREQEKLNEAKDAQIKELIVKQTGQIKELENQVTNKDNELKKEKYKTRRLQGELENLRNEFNGNKARIAYLESQIKTKEEESVELKDQETNLKEEIKNEKPSKEPLPLYVNKSFLGMRDDRFWSSFFFTLYISPYFRERKFCLINYLNNIIVPDHYTKEIKIKLLETIKDENIYVDIIKFLFRNIDIKNITEDDKQKIKEKILLAYGFHPSLLVKRGIIT